MAANETNASVEETTAAAAAATEKPLLPTQKSLEEVGHLIRKPPITNWAHEETQGFVVTKDLFPELSKYLSKLDWDVIVALDAPPNTPDIGFVFTRLKDYATGRYSTKPSYLRKIENNLSFLAWNSLMTCKQILNLFKRRRLNWDLLQIALTNSVNAWCVGASSLKTEEPPTAADDAAAAAPPEKKKRKKASSAKSKGVKTESAGDVPISSPQQEIATALPNNEPHQSPFSQPIAVQPTRQ